MFEMTKLVRQHDEALRECEVRPHSKIYSKVKDLYEEAFPPEERIDLAILDELANEHAAEFTAYFDEERFCGFSYSIDTGNYLYLLFLAVSSDTRSHGYGTRILGQIKTRFPERVIVLEVEPVDQSAPNALQREKRFAFYRRNGFVPTGYNSVYGDMNFMFLKTSGPFDASSCAGEISSALRGLVPFELRLA